MKLEILQENFNHALSLVAKVLSTRPQMAILSNILLKTNNGQLEITASNLETTMTTSVGAKIEEDGQYTVPGRTLLEVVNGLPAGKLALFLQEGALLVSSGKFKTKIAGIDASEYPKLIEDGQDNNLSWSLDSKIFKAMLNRTVFASAIDESRAVLTGVLFESGKAGLTLAATDGFRLSVNKLGLKDESVESKFIIPAKALSEVSRIISTGIIKLSFLAASNQVLFDLGEVKIYSRVIAGNFPDYGKIIPTNSATKIVMTVDELLKAVKLASVFARDSANIIKLKIENKKLKISANAPQVGENESEVDVQIEKGGDEEFTIAFNYRYLLDLLANIESNELVGEFTGPLNSGLFRLPNDSNFLHIIMPVRVQG